MSALPDMTHWQWRFEPPREAPPARARPGPRADKRGPSLVFALGAGFNLAETPPGRPPLPETGEAREGARGRSCRITGLLYTLHAQAGAQPERTEPQ